MTERPPHLRELPPEAVALCQARIRDWLTSPEVAKPWRSMIMTYLPPDLGVLHQRAVIDELHIWIVLLASIVAAHENAEYDEVLAGVRSLREPTEKG